MLLTKIFTLSSAAMSSTTAAYGVVNDYLADLVVAPPAPQSVTIDAEPNTISTVVDEVRENIDNAAHIMPKLVGEVDETALFAASTFPIAPMALIARAKVLLNPEIQLGQKDGGACLADDFEFVAAVVGPIGKKEYLGALESFRLEDSFDITPNFFGFSVDPTQTNRVLFFNRQEATQTNAFMGAEPIENKLILPPQTYHMDFNEQGDLKEFGFYTADRRYGNTGGLGGAFGYFYGVGKPLPIPECQPFKKSKRFRMLNFVSRLGAKFSNKK